MSVRIFTDSASFLFIIYGNIIRASSYFTAYYGAKFLFNGVSRDARRLKDHIKDNVKLQHHSLNGKWVLVRQKHGTEQKT